MLSASLRQERLHRQSTLQTTVTLRRFLLIFVALGTIYAIGVRLSLSNSLPLWLDETWSGMIATRESWPKFWREAWLDCNPPLYYLFLAGWVSLFGDSNLMLRLPSILFILAAAALPIIRRPRGLSRTGAWTFAALLILWQPGLYVMIDARGYGFIFLLSTASCLAVAAMLDRLTLAGAVTWVSLGTMMFLTHYYSGVLILGQGLVLFYRHRARMLRVWPATFIALPGLAWFAYHVSRLKDYARPDVAWYDKTDGWSALAHLFYVLGVENFVSLGAVVLVMIIATLSHRRIWTKSGIESLSDVQNLALTSATSGIGFVIAIVIGMIQASLADRYFVPLAAPTMLGLALMVQRCPHRELTALMLAFVYLLPHLNAQTTRKLAEGRAIYGYEDGSNFVQSYQPDQLLFLWDHPAAKIMDRRSLEAVGSYFFKRAGIDIPTRALVVPISADANAILRAAANGRRPALIWLYDTAHRSAAHEHMPTFEEDPAWICRHRWRKTIRSGRLGAIACVRMGVGS